MKKLILATVLATIGSVSAFAADLPARTWTKAPIMVAPVANWTGFYVGGNVGYGWGDGKLDSVFFPNEATFAFQNGSVNDTPNGVLGGAQIGYNWQTNAYVFGIEADFQGSNIHSSSQKELIDIIGDVDAFSFRSSNQNLSWFGTVRGRLGTSITPNFLFYGTGGLAYGHLHASANILVTDNGAFLDQVPASIGRTKAGWTAGAGAEWMFANNWSAKLEYLYLDLGKVSVDGFSAADSTVGAHYTWKIRDNIVRAGVNYHF